MPAGNSSSLLSMESSCLSRLGLTLRKVAMLDAELSFLDFLYSIMSGELRSRLLLFFSILLVASLTALAVEL